MNYLGPTKIEEIDIDNIAKSKIDKLSLLQALSHYLKKDNFDVSLALTKFAIYYKYLHFMDIFNECKKYNNQASNNLKKFITKYYLSD